MRAKMNSVARHEMAGLRGVAFGVLWAILLVGFAVGGGAPAHARQSDMGATGTQRVASPASMFAMIAPGAAISQAVQAEMSQAGRETAFLAPAIRAHVSIKVAQWGAARGPNPIENFFSTLFGGRQQPRPDEDRTRILITPGSGGGAAASQQSQTPRGGSRAYCVRTCDGRFFPLGARVDRGSYGVGQAQCQSMCPAAEMELFTSSGEIGTAVNSRGRSYASLPAAFLFRRQVVEGCSCNSSGMGGGLQHVDIKNDPTLKAGDVVMTKDGPLVFAGNRRGPPFQDTDFVPPAHFPKLSKEMRQRLKELTVAIR